MKKICNKSIFSLLLAFLLLLPNFNYVVSAVGSDIVVEVPQDQKELVELLYNSPEKVRNDDATPDEGSEDIFQKKYKSNSNVNMFTSFNASTFGANSTANDSDNPVLFWNGVNNNPTRVVATVNGDPKYELGFNWYTSEEAKSHVLISKSPKMTNSIKYEAVSMGVYSQFVQRNEDGSIFFDENGYERVGERPEYIYKAKATNLSPNTVYYYKVGSNEEGFGYSPVGTFKTAGYDGQNFSFIHYTDTQNYFGNQDYMDEAWYGADTLKQALKIDPSADFVVHTGDIVEISESEDEWIDILEQSKKSIMSKLFVPVAGNHDELSFYNGYSRPLDFNRHMNVPAVNNAIDGGSYYSYDYNGVHFIVANTNDYKRSEFKSIGPEQREWIREDVEKARANGAKWVILAYHKPLYSKSYHSLSDTDVQNVKQELMELIDEYDIDLCMQGHDHVLARTKSLKYTPDSPFYAYIADEGINGDHRTYKDTDGTIFVLPNTAGTKVYDDFYSKGLEHTHAMRPNLKWMTQEDLDEYNGLFALGGQPAQHPRFATKYSNARDSIIQNFAHYEFINGDLHVKMYQIEGEKGSNRTVKVIDSFVLSKTKAEDPVTPVDPVKPVTPIYPVDPVKPKEDKKQEEYRKDGALVDFIFHDPISSKSKDSIKDEKPIKEEEKQEDKPVEITVKEFIDIKDHWAEKAIKHVTEKGYFKGTSENTFTPENNISLGEFVTVLGRIAKVDEKAYSTSDSDEYYVPYMKWALEKGIIPDELKDKDEKHVLNREEMAKILDKYLSFKEYKLEDKTAVEFKDQDEIADWAKEAVDSLVSKEVLKGMGDDKFSPKSNFTRAQVAQVLYNLDTMIGL